MSELMIFSGNSIPEASQHISEHLKRPLGRVFVGRFSDGEINIEILENVRGKDTFILQSTSFPCNDHLMELVILADALRRASATRITAVVPYFGYARQDRRVRSARVPISAKVVADMIMAVGIHRVLTVDLHADQIQGFFHIPVDNVYSTPVVLKDIRTRYQNNVIVVSPDVGGVVRARALAKRLDDTELAIIDKRRPAPNQSKVMHIIGEVSGKTCLIVDDIVDTAGTLYQASMALKEHGAHRVVAYCTHAVLSGNAVDNIEKAPLDELVVTDTIALNEKAKACSKIRVLSLSAMLAEAIHRVSQEESLSSMFV